MDEPKQQRSVALRRALDLGVELIGNIFVSVAMVPFLAIEYLGANFRNGRSPEKSARAGSFPTDKWLVLKRAQQGIPKQIMNTAVIAGAIAGAQIRKPGCAGRRLLAAVLLSSATAHIAQAEIGPAFTGLAASANDATTVFCKGVGGRRGQACKIARSGNPDCLDLL